MNELNEAVKKQAEYFYKDGTCVHINMNQEGVFYNGDISEISDDFIILVDRMLGELPIFFIQIKSIEPYKEK